MNKNKEKNMRFTVEHIKHRQKQYLSLVYTNEENCKVYFIYKDKKLFGGWYSLNDNKKVMKKLVPILDEAMKKVSENI